MSYKTIKKVTELTGITEGALRYYDEKNVIKPTIKKTTGRREWLYDDEAIKKLCLIKLFTFIGVPVRIAGLMLENGLDFSELILNMQIGAIKSELKKGEYKISLAESLLNQGTHAELVNDSWLMKQIKHIELIEKEKEKQTK